MLNTIKTAKILAICLILLLGALAGCTDTNMAVLRSLGDEGTISCYSGGVLIYEGASTGKVQNISGSDGWEFKDKKTGKLIRVSGDCVITN